MDNAEILRGTLALYDWTESEMNRRRLEAIVDVQHHLIQRFEKVFYCAAWIFRSRWTATVSPAKAISPCLANCCTAFRPVCRHPLIYSVDADSATYRKMFAMDRTPQPARTGLTEGLLRTLTELTFTVSASFLNKANHRRHCWGAQPIRQTILSVSSTSGMGFPVSESKSVEQDLIILTRHPRCAPRFWGCTVWIHRCRQPISTTSRSAGTAMKR